MPTSKTISDDVHAATSLNSVRCAAYSRYSGYENSRPIAATRPGAIDAADPDERLLPRDARHRTADERLDEQEQRGAEADAEREDPDHRRGGNRRAREVTGREAKVLNRVFDHVHAPHVPARFLRLLDAAEGAQRRLARLLARHAAGDIRRHAPVDVVADLVVELLLDASAAEHRSQSKPQSGQQAPQPHRYNSFNLTTREMAPESRSQSAISRSRACAA